MSTKLSYIVTSFFHGFDDLLIGHWIIAVVFAALLVVGLALPQVSNRRLTRFVTYLTLVLITVALVRSALTAFLVDEALVDFHYADNLRAGLGLVFNRGELVNGFGSVLWVLWLAISSSLGIPLPWFATLSTLLSLLLILLVVARCSRRMRPGDKTHGLSISVYLLSACSLFAHYGTSGLPTMPTALFALLSFYWLSKRPMGAGMCGAIAGLLDPRCLVLVIVQATGTWLLRRKCPTKYLLGTSSLLVPILAWTWCYYGETWPLAVYSNNYLEPRFDHGFTYLVIALLRHGLWALIPAAVIGSFDAAPSGISRIAIVSALAYLAGVLWTGGDRFEGHLLIVVLPALFLAAERGIRAAWAGNHRGWAVVLSLPAGALLLQGPLLGSQCQRWELDDPTCFDRVEHAGLSTNATCESTAAALRSAFPDSRPRVTVATTCPGTVGYRTGEPTVDLTGKVDSHLAQHQLAFEYGRVKDINAHSAYLYERGVDLSEVPIWPERYRPLSVVRIGSATFHLGRYRQDVIDRLASAKAGDVPNVSSHLNTYPADASEVSKNCDRWFLEAFYFDQAHTTERTPFLSRLGLGENVTSFYGYGEVDRVPGWEFVHTLQLFSSEEQPWLQAGPAFAGWPTQGAAPSQPDLSKPLEWTINSFQAHPLEHANGRLQSPEFNIEGDLISMRIGGSMNEQTVYAALLIDGEMVRRATGCDSNILSRQAWDVTPYRGRRARVLLVDEHPDSGFLIVGDIKQWRRRLPEARGKW